MTYRDRYEMVLRAMPGTVDQIAAITGASRHSVERWARTLRRMGWAHVPEWERREGPGRTAPVIYGGPGENVPQPAISAQQALFNYRQRLRRDRDRYDRVRAAEKARKMVDKIIKSGRKASPFDALGVVAAPERLQKGPYKTRNAEK